MSIPLLTMAPDETIEALDARAGGSPIYLVLTKDGLFRRVRNPFYKIIDKSEGSLPFGELKEGAVLTTNPIPREMLLDIIGFFKAVYNKFKGEGICVLFYSTSRREWAWEVPPQETTENGLHVDYKIEETPNPGGDFRIFGTAHSHGSASAFQSGTDSADEKDVDGIHITVGGLPDNPSLHTRLILGGSTWTMPEEELIAGLITGTTWKPEFLERVKAKTFITGYAGGVYGGAQGRFGHSDYYDGYDDGLGVVAPSEAKALSNKHGMTIVGETIKSDGVEEYYRRTQTAAHDKPWYGRCYHDGLITKNRYEELRDSDVAKATKGWTKEDYARFSKERRERKDRERAIKQAAKIREENRNRRGR